MNKFSRFTFIFTLLATFFLISFTTGDFVYSHEARYSGNISASLHIDPNDQPRAQEESILNFTVADTTRRFDFSHCNCRVEIRSASTSDSIILSGTGVTAQAPYTFPTSGSYEIVFIGNPVNDADFETFNYSYNSYYVESSFAESENNASEKASPTGSVFNSTILYLILGILLISLIFVIFNKVRGGESSEK